MIILFCKIWTTCKKERDCYFMAINWGKQADFLHSVLRAAKLSSERKKMFLFSKEPENINWASVCGNYMQETRYEIIECDLNYIFYGWFTNLTQNMQHCFRRLCEIKYIKCNTLKSCLFKNKTSIRPITIWIRKSV